MEDDFSLSRALTAGNASSIYKPQFSMSAGTSEPALTSSTVNLSFFPLTPCFPSSTSRCRFLSLTLHWASVLDFLRFSLALNFRRCSSRWNSSHPSTSFSLLLRICSSCSFRVQCLNQSVILAFGVTSGWGFACSSPSSRGLGISTLSTPTPSGSGLASE